MVRKKQQWQVGDYFGIPIQNESFAIGQILGRYDWIGVACIISNIQTNKKTDLNKIEIPDNNIISAIFITEESLNKGFWPILLQGCVNRTVLEKYFPNIDKVENGDIVGITTEGSAIIDDFIQAYFGLKAWNDWYESDFLDKEILISPDKKPDNVIYK